jgi:hypothetical protein
MAKKRTKPEPTDWELLQLKQLRNELHNTTDIVDHPDEYGALWRRLDYHLNTAWHIVNDAVRVAEGEDPNNVEGGTLDTAAVAIEVAIGELKETLRRLDEYTEGAVQDHRAGLRAV